MDEGVAENNVEATVMAGLGVRSLGCTGRSSADDEEAEGGGVCSFRCSEY